MPIYKDNFDFVPYSPSDDERKFMTQAYTDFVNDYNIKEQGWDILNGRTLEQFWADSNYDYNQIVPWDDTTNPVTPYSSGISRDKANVFISNLSAQLAIPSVTAQNREQQIDHVVSKVGKGILEWQFSNDGRPAESGYVKNMRGIHRMVVEGTVHVEDVVNDEGILTSNIWENEEVFIPNFYQPNLQLQPHLMRVQQYVTYGEAEAEFGLLPNWKYVQEGQLAAWITEIEEFKEWYKAVYQPKSTSIIRVWYNIPKKELKQLKKEGKINRKVKKGKYYNVIVNGVLMFDPDNVMPYWHGQYPVSKGIFEQFSPSNFYWGNSMPNKSGQDKKFLDGWKTLIRYKAKLGTIPALLNFTGQKIDQDIAVPGQTTDMPTGTEAAQIVPVPGISNGISNGDIVIMKDATEDVNRETASPQSSGQQTSGSQTARETLIIEANAQKAMSAFAQQVAFLAEARSFPILKSSFQFLTRRQVKQISIPGQIFEGGKEGVLEVIFEDLSKIMAKENETSKQMEERLSFKLLEEEDKSEREGKVIRKVKVDKSYIQELEYYCKAVADSLPRETSALKQARASLKFDTYAARPDLFKIKTAARNFVREMGDNEDELVIEEQPQAPPQPQVPSPQTKAVKKSAVQQTANMATGNLL